MTILLDTLKETCGGCPSAWEAESRKGKSIYIRYRWGFLSVTADDKDVAGFTPKGAGTMDGVMSKDEMIKNLTKRANIKFA